MPRFPRNHVPSYRLHKASGQAVVTLNGCDHYLGRHGSPESHAEYARLIAAWSAGTLPRGTQPTRPGLTVSELLAAYWQHAQEYYRKADPDTGERLPTSQRERVRRALAAVRDLYGPTPAAAFGPLGLQAVRGQLVARGLVRQQVNLLVGCIRRAWKWAAAQELVPAQAWQALCAVEGLKAGRSDAAERGPVLPVPETDIAPVKAHALPVIGDLIDLQLLTAARPGELLDLRPAELERAGTVWTYRPRGHKTAHRGRGRLVLIGPRAQQILTPYLARPADTYCFSPAEAVLRYLAEHGREPRVKAGDRYHVASYSRAVRKGCCRAGVAPWYPHRLRHNAATRLVEEFGWDVARIILGHADLGATRLYAENDLARAVAAVSRVG